MKTVLSHNCHITILGGFVIWGGFSREKDIYVIVFMFCL